MTREAEKIINTKITERAQVGDNALALGIDMNCLPCITYPKITGIENGMYVIYCREDGIEFVTDDISDYYPDTPKNREIIKNACKQVRAAHGW